MYTSPRKHRFTAGLAGVAGVAGLSLFATACGADTTTPVATGVITDGIGDTADAATIRTVSAAEGASARQARDAAIGGVGGGRLAAGAEAATLVAGTADALPIDCGTGGVPYEPTAEEIAAANADSDALAAVLDTYGISYERIVDDLGFAYIETDYTDAIAQSVVASFWNDRYPPEPIPAEEIARIQAENDAIAAALDAAGVSYTRQSDEAGWEWIEYDYENVAAQEAVNAVYAELYPPKPPAPEELERMQAENDALAAAFDAAGIAYTRVADDAGWEWLEWDYEDQATSEAVQAVFDELYPVEPGDGLIEPCLAVEDGLVREGEVSNEGGETPGTLPLPVPVDGVETLPLPVEGDVGVAVEGEVGIAVGGEAGIAIAEPGYEDVAEAPPVDVELDKPISSDDLTIAPDSGFTDEQIAERDAEIATMIAGFSAAGVDHDVIGESPWTTVLFDLDNAAAVQVIADILAARG